MKELLYFFEITGKKENTETVNELLSSLEIDYSANTEVDEGISCYTFYSNTKNEAESKLNTVTTALKCWHSLNLQLKVSEISTLKKEDWTEVWKKFFKIQHISDRVVIKASWLEYTAKPGQVVVEIDPGMSFGTGSHETTQCCLQLLEKLSSHTGNKSLLDAGCGSGILSIAAKKLGYSPIYAFDYDSESVLASKENFKRNNVNQNEIDLCQADISQYSPKMQFDYVVANIISSVLTCNKNRLISWVKPGGYLVLAGILRTEYDKIRDVFMKTNELTEISTHTEKEWTGALFIKK